MLRARDRPETSEPSHLRGRRDLADRRRDRPEEAREAEAGGAEALLADAQPSTRSAPRAALPILHLAAGSAGDARIVRPGDDDVELGDASSSSSGWRGEDELEEALERLDPGAVRARRARRRRAAQHVLDLLSDLPAGKLAIADIGGATQAQIDELERAGVDAVLVRELA